jgi:hypothetical protein
MAGGVEPRVIEFISRTEPGQTFTLDDLTDTLELTETSAQTVMYRIVKNQKWPLETVSRGRVWRNLAGPADGQEKAGPQWDVSMIEDMDTVKVLKIDGFVYVARRIGLAED